MSLRENVSGALLRMLPERAFLSVRRSYHTLRRRSAPLMKLVYGTFSTEELIRSLDAHTDEDWQILMVHSSVNCLAPMYQGNAMELLTALVAFVGPERTLVMPAFNFGSEYGGAREALKQNPRFDMRRTPSEMGLLTEVFRRSRGVLQSRHPVSRVAALGPLAEEIVHGHEHVPGGLGPGSPFDTMARHNAQIVGIGKTFGVMTQAHHVDNLPGLDWPAPTRELPSLPVTLIEKDRETEMCLGGTQQQWRFNIWKLRDMMSSEQLLEWQFHGCPMFAARAGEVTDTLVEAARRGVILYDPT